MPPLDPAPDSSLDEELIVRLLAGDEAALGQVRGWVRGALHRFRGSFGDEVEDVEQDAMLDLLLALEAGRFRRDSRLSTYVASFTRFKCIDRLRASGRREWVDVATIELENREESVLDRLGREEDADLAHRVLAEIPAPCHEMWQMVLDGLSYKEMANRLRLSEGTVRVRVFRCRQKALAVRDRLRSRDEV